MDVSSGGVVIVVMIFSWMLCLSSLMLMLQLMLPFSVLLSLMLLVLLCFSCGRCCYRCGGCCWFVASVVVLAIVCIIFVVGLYYSVF